MRKNKNGFTLIELLAVIVIMGILSIMVIPKLTNLAMQTREEIYLQDAKKLLAQAHYKMNSNSVDIDKPEKGECIVFSMNYLNINDFRNPPNDGTYMNESSFVVVRNNEDKYEYAVLLIEERKDGLYQGVEFITEIQLNEKDSIKHVRYFDERDIRYIDSLAAEEANGIFVDDNYINRQLAKSGVKENPWLQENSIIGTYNRAKMKEGLVADASEPKFVATISPRGVVNEIGTLNAILTVSATDEDDSLDCLTVCSKVSSSLDDSYPTLETDRNLCENYGTRKFYTKIIDFARYGFSYSESDVTAYVYVTVTDPSGNTTRKQVEYQIHKNEDPMISQLSFLRRTTDIENMPIAVLQIDVHDDLDELGDLQVCFHQDIEDYETCHGDYYPFYEVFNAINQMEYSFKDSEGNPITIPDGSTHNLTVFIKDQDDGVGVKTAEYTIYSNENPDLVEVTLIPDTINGYNSLYYDVSLVITDDLDVNNVFVKINDEEPVTYREFLKNVNISHVNPLYRAEGFFDGEDREVTVKIWDEYQTEEDAVVKTVTLSNVYNDVAPLIDSISIEGMDSFCLDNNRYYCNTKKETDTGGSYEATVKLDLFDYLVSDKNLYPNLVKVCLSEDENGCSVEDESQFVPYSKSFNFNFAKPSSLYAGEEARQLYVTLIKSNTIGEETRTYSEKYGPYSYDIYENQAPTFRNDSFTITSTAPNNSGNFKVVNIDMSSVSVNDDFNSYTLSFCYSIEDGDPICTEYYTKNEFISHFISSFEFKYANGDPILYYDSQKIEAYIMTKDHLDVTAESNHVIYELFMDQYPTIVDVEVSSKEETYNTNTVYFTMHVLDVGDTYTICVKEGSDACLDEEYKGNSSGNPFSGDYVGTKYGVGTYIYNGVEHGWSSNYSEVNPNKVFHVYVKDSQGHVTEYSTTLSYTVYIACVDPEHLQEIKVDYQINPTATPISMDYCEGLCYRSAPGRKKNDIYANYNKFTYNKDLLIGYNCPRVITQERKYCDYSTCFQHPESSEPSYIELTVQERSEVWTDMPEGEVMAQLIEKPYCDNYINNNEMLFNNKDTRCKTSSYCSSTASSVCSSNPDFNTCRTEYLSRCNAALAKFCNKGLEESMHEISCTGADLSNENIVQRVCEKDFIGGKCYENSNSCYENSPDCTEEEISAGTCTQVLKDSCQNVCYEKVNCANETTLVPAVVTCHGYYRLYTSTIKNGQLFLANTGLRICPEVLTKYPEHYEYDHNSSRPYVLFNASEQSLLM